MSLGFSLPDMGNSDCRWSGCQKQPKCSCRPSKFDSDLATSLTLKPVDRGSNRLEPIYEVMNYRYYYTYLVASHSIPSFGVLAIPD